MQPDRRNHYALIGDVAASRALPDRAGVQRRLQAAVADLNERLAEALAVPLKLTAGDEVQALLAEPDVTMEIMVRLADELRPVRMVWGLGRGPLDTDPSDDISVLDGPCLHRARDAVDAGKAEGRWLAARGLGEPHERVLEAIVALLHSVRESWTDTRFRYVREARGRRQHEVAEHLEVSKQAVHKALQAARFTETLEGEAAVRDLLRWLAAHEPATHEARA